MPIAPSNKRASFLGALYVLAVLPRSSVRFGYLHWTIFSVSVHWKRSRGQGPRWFRQGARDREAGCLPRSSFPARERNHDKPLNLMTAPHRREPRYTPDRSNTTSFFEAHLRQAARSAPAPPALPARQGCPPSHRKRCRSAIRASVAGHLRDFSRVVPEVMPTRSRR
jgi:hypothetical protein